MKDEQEKTAAQWVTNRNGQIGWMSDGTVAVDLKGIRGAGSCIHSAIRDWKKRRRRLRL